VHRLQDHDGQEPGEGGLEQWLDLALAVGLERAEVVALRGVLPGVRTACDDYVRFVESNDLLASVASSLTEMFAGDIMRRRIAAFEKHYPWVLTEGLRYFENRTRQAPRDAAFGLRFVLEHANSADDQVRCVAALERKCEILWRLLDAVEAAGRHLRLSRHAQLRTDRAADQTLVVLPERAVRLNPSGREILDMCDGGRSAGEIARVLRSRHPEIEQVESDVHHFLEQMERVGVLEVAP
jgi:coenzyme PQQ biosynthesis protein PqqD